MGASGIAVRSVRIRTVQGVGDIFWVYQKLAPYVDAIDLSITILRHDEVQRRAVAFVKLMPKVRSVDFELQQPWVYHQLAQSYTRLDQVLQSGGAYACNARLEQGVRLEAMDPGFDPQWDVPLLVPEERYLPGEYVAAYVSGNKHDSSWDDDVWADFIAGVVWAKGLTRQRVVIVGASYDAGRANSVADKLHRVHSVGATAAIDLPAAEVVRVLRDASFFIGYQSGLNVLADNYDTPQVMVYFPHLRKMMNTWCKPGHAESGVFRAFTFDQRPAEIISALRA